MTKESSYMGAELKKKREARNITLEELANRTKINITFLKKIEEGDFDFLPKIYTRSFIKLYAQEVGLEGDVYARRFDLHFKKEEMEQKSPPPIDSAMKDKKVVAKDKKKDQKKTNGIKVPESFSRFGQSKLAWFLGAVAILLVLIFILLYINSNNSEMPKSSGEIKEIPIEEMLPKSEPETELPVQVPDSVRLTLLARDTVWVSVAIDQRHADELTFYPGNEQKWTARDQIVIRIGKTYAVTLRINDEEPRSVTQYGRVATLKITRNGIENLSP